MFTYRSSISVKFTTYLYTYRIHAIPKWLTHNDGEYVAYSPFTFMANSSWSKLWIFCMSGGKVEKNSKKLKPFCTFRLKVQQFQCIKNELCTNGNLTIWYCHYCNGACWYLMEVKLPCGMKLLPWPLTEKN